MTIFETLQDAIQRKKPISYEYVSDSDPARGERRGDPYALYIFEKKDGTTSTKVDIYQLSGASSKGGLNKFKMCNIDNISNVRVLEDEPGFGDSLQSEYNPNSDRYKNVIAQV